MNHGAGDTLPDELGRQVHMVVVDHDDGRFGVILGLIRDGFGEGAVHRNVPILPGVVDAGVQVWVVRRVPHVVLEEPHQGVAEDVVVLVVDAPRGQYEAETNAVARKGRWDAGAAAALVDSPIAIADGAGDPGEVHHLGQGAEGRHHPATSPPGLYAARGAYMVLDGTPIADQDQPPIRQDSIAQFP